MKHKKTLNENLELIARSMNILEGIYEQLYSDETFNNTIWDDTFEITTVNQIECKGIKELYIFNGVDTTRLTHVFRYIKELLLQNHTLRMYLNHKTLKHNNMNVYSVKADAFTMDAYNLDIAKSLIKFDNNIGSWRLSNTDDISYPKVKLTKNEAQTLNSKL